MRDIIVVHVAYLQGFQPSKAVDLRAKAVEWQPYQPLKTTPMTLLVHKLLLVGFLHG